LPFASRYSGRSRERRDFAEVGERLATVGELQRRESATAEIARGRVHHGQRIADRTAASIALPPRLSTSTPTRVASLLRGDDHAVLGGDRRGGGGVAAMQN